VRLEFKAFHIEILIYSVTMLLLMGENLGFS